MHIDCYSLIAMNITVVIQTNGILD
jgi:hypothetical protein